MTQKLTLALFALMFALPSTAHAYLNPEDVLLNRELYLPPEARDARERTELQAQESAARREREQERAFALQHPAPPEPVVMEEPMHAAAPMQAAPMFVYPAAFPGGGAAMFAPQASALGNTANLELMRTMRLLSRVNQNQAVSELSQVLHSGAPDLAPTGAGGVLALGTMLGAVAVTLRRAGKSERQIMQ